MLQLRNKVDKIRVGARLKVGIGDGDADYGGNNAGEIWQAVLYVVVVVVACSDYTRTGSDGDANKSDVVVNTNVNDNNDCVDVDGLMVTVVLAMVVLVAMLFDVPTKVTVLVV